MKDGINIWHFSNFPNKPTLIYCHGTSGNISDQANVVKLAHRLQINLVLFDYYGYGKSNGHPSQANLFKSADVMYTYVFANVSGTIFVWGESLGGAVAVYLAAKYKVDCLILLSTFASLDILAKGHERSWLIQLLGRSLPYVTQPLRSCDTIKKVVCPVIIMHSHGDGLIPYENAEILYNNITHSDKKLVTIEGIHASPLIKLDVLQHVVAAMKLQLPRAANGNVVDFTDILTDIYRNSPFAKKAT